jgi:DNA-binding NarL/FixJ family response regulator
MTLLVAVGSDHDVLVRWSDMAHKSGHESVILPAATLRGRPQIGAGVCLYDMGCRGGSDPQPLLDAVKTCPDTRFVAMSANPNAQEGLRLLRGGVRGYCNRLLSVQAPVVLISTLENGEIWAGKQVTQYLLEAALAKEPAMPTPAGPSPFGQLTARETEIAEQVAAGHSNKVIAAEHGISERTVKAHLNAIFRKTGLHNRVQLALAISQANRDSWRLSNG